MRRSLLSIFCFAACVMGSAAVQAQPIDYERQEGWVAQLDKAQSPVDIVTASASNADPREARGIVLLKSRTRMKAIDNSHAIEVEARGPEALIRGRHFRMEQFHFHAESEHTIDGQHFPLEGHFFFRAQDGRMAVVAVMYTQGAANSLAGRILDALGTDQELPLLDIGTLLPKSLSYFHYLGSLTTPPLTENVEWYVLPQPVTLSAAQLARFSARYSHNNRAVQPMNKRPLVHAGLPAGLKETAARAH